MALARVGSRALTTSAEIPCLITQDHLHHIWQDRKQRYMNRDRTGRRLRSVLNNEYQQGWRDVVPTGQEPVVANLIKAASDTITWRVGRFPRITADPVRRRTSDLAVKRAQGHQIQLQIDLRRIGFRATLAQGVHWLVNHGMVPLLVRPSAFYGVPVIEARDPLSCYPGTVYPHKPEVYDVLFATTMPAFQAIRMYPQIAAALSSMDRGEPAQEVVLGEYVDETGTVVALLEPRVEIVNWLPSPLPGRCLAFVGRPFSEDMDFHGSFDHSVAPLIAQAKLNALVMTLAEMNVFAETNVFGEFGGNQSKYNWGPAAVNYFQPGVGARVEKSINNMSPQVFQVINQFERAIRMDAGFPGQLSGEPVATIATGKGLEELTTTVDDHVGYKQSVVQDLLLRVLPTYAELATAMKTPGAENYQSREDVVLTVQHLSGSDPSELIGKLQMIDAGLLSKRSAMEGMAAVDDAELMEREIDAEALRQAILKGVEQQAAMPAAAGGMDPVDVAKVIVARRQGVPLEEAMVALAKDKERAAQAAQATPGAGGPPSLEQMLSGAVGGGGPPGGAPQTAGNSLGQARAAERMMSQAPFAGTAAQVAGAQQVQRTLGGPPAMAGSPVPAV